MVENIQPEFKEIILSSETDGIFRDNMHLNFSQLAGNIQTMVTEFQAFKKEKHKMDSLDDIKVNFLYNRIWYIPSPSLKRFQITFQNTSF